MESSCPPDIMGGQSVIVMNKYVSLDKRSKKAQREYHAKQRIGKEFRNGFDADLFFRKLLTLLRIRTILRIRSNVRR